ncbi:MULTISPECIES: DUF6193 family natural product biosynthesis protein [unclassified Streptomyces]|uniref:DUF6193 family natural product biosynthesis protein n=1 Tax=unclassified Streptomyces TaxID=2593676 RepID=UPI002DD84459|nr:DUF6193 family natural product biosynthesis protein [Streptomyces sp. NBC_00243]WRZ25445.1 DUF6193 family natural product biosynthesis protein [Streptomyces sp. NBC_00243]
MDPDLYPDLAAAGSLAAALELVAAELTIDVSVVPGDWGTSVSAVSPPPVPFRRPLLIFLAADTRLFLMGGRSRGVELIRGSTSDLRDVVLAAVAWGEGRSLSELQELFSFLSTDELAMAHEIGPAAVVDLQWRLLREQAASEPGFPEFGLLVEAAHAEPMLQQLSAFSSHWTLGFSASTSHSSSVEVAVTPAYNGRPYQVRKFLHEGVIGEAETAEQAVALAIAHLPAGLGPAVAGSDDL